ncbi:MAG: GrpB family protein [Caulobacteraceae bacterium]|nr:GrpB family protein [Caulobacteraceae bacterium]
MTLAPHQADWAPRAAREARRWAEVLGDNLLVVHHVGSTAIPWIAAKPIIDLMPAVRDLAALDAAEPAIRALGYDWRGEFGLPGRRFCLLTDPRTGARLFHVHAYQAGSSEIDRHLAFRDYLLAHRDEALAYEAQKRAAAAAHPNDSLAYNGAKSDWIVACQARALAWWPGVSGRA